MKARMKVYWLNKLLVTKGINFRSPKFLTWNFHRAFIKTSVTEGINIRLQKFLIWKFHPSFHKNFGNRRNKLLVTEGINFRSPKFLTWNFHRAFIKTSVTEVGICCVFVLQVTRIKETKRLIWLNKRYIAMRHSRLTRLETNHRIVFNGDYCHICDSISHTLILD